MTATDAWFPAVAQPIGPTINRLTPSTRAEIRHRFATFTGWSWVDEQRVWAVDIAEAVTEGRTPSPTSLLAFELASRLAAIRAGQIIRSYFAQAAS